MSDIVERLRQNAGPSGEWGELADRLQIEAADEIERLRAEVAFLHKRRGEIVIERDRYKAALGEYPDGRDVILGGALAEVERLRAELAAMYAKHPENACYDVPTWDKLRAELAAVGDKLLAEIAKSDQLKKHLVACNTANVRLATELNAAKSVIENIVVSEVEPLQALLREALIHLDGGWRTGELYRSIRAALSDQPTPPNASEKP